MKPVSLLDGTVVLFKTINDKTPHADYETVTQLAKDYTIYTTGKGVETRLKQFTPRETKEVFEQRVRLTQVTTPDIVGSCTKPMYKSWQNASAKKSLS